MSTYDAPNQQVVRADGSAPWDEGAGAAAGPDPGDEQPTVDEMTKAQLLSYATDHDIEIDETQTKAEILAAIREAE